jgi:hypothetical protein
MEGGGFDAVSYAVHSSEEVFHDYRASMIKVLTTGTFASPPIGLLSSTAAWIRAIDRVCFALCRCGQVHKAVRPW